MISEGSCDTEDWSSDAENSAGNIKIVKIKIYHRNARTYRVRDLISCEPCKQPWFGDWIFE